MPVLEYLVYILGQDMGYMGKYSPLPEGEGLYLNVEFLCSQYIINRPGVAGTVLQTPLHSSNHSLIH